MVMQFRVSLSAYALYMHVYVYKCGASNLPIGRAACCGCTLLQCVAWPARHTVVEGFYKHVGVDPCTLSVYSSKPFQTHTLHVCILFTILLGFLPGGDSWPTPLGTWCSTSGSTHQTHVCQRLHLVESEPLIVLMDVK